MYYLLIIVVVYVPAISFFESVMAHMAAAILCAILFGLVAHYDQLPKMKNTPPLASDSYSNFKYAGEGSFEEKFCGKSGLCVDVYGSGSPNYRGKNVVFHTACKKDGTDLVSDCTFNDGWKKGFVALYDPASPVTSMAFNNYINMITWYEKSGDIYPYASPKCWNGASADDNYFWFNHNNDYYLWEKSFKEVHVTEDEIKKNTGWVMGPSDDLKERMRTEKKWESAHCRNHAYNVNRYVNKL